MKDSDRLNWIQEHLVSFRESLREEDSEPYDLEWMDDSGYHHVTRGNSIRHCVNQATEGKYYE